MEPAAREMGEERRRPEGPGPLRFVYSLPVLLSILGLLIGAAVAWATHTALYRRVGIIRVSPSLPDALQRGPPPPLRDLAGILESHIELLLSPRATALAMASQTWQPHAQGGTAEAREDFEARRTVTAEPRTQHILVEFVDTNPEAAGAGSAALIEAYEELHEQPEPPPEGSGATRPRPPGRVSVKEAGQVPRQPFNELSHDRLALWELFGALLGGLVGVSALRLSPARISRR